MKSERSKILSFRLLEIGYRSGNHERILLPPAEATAYEGELVAVIGENGIGKSTLLRTICGLQASLGGSVFLKEISIEEYHRNILAMNIGYISTEPVRVSNMKVSDLVSLGRYPHTDWTGRLSPIDREIIGEAITKVGLQDLAGRYINELSDGERQRAMIARVLAQDTDVLVLDEPTAFLDIKSKYEIIHLLHNLTRQRGKTIIFSTHDLITAMNEADKIWLVMKDAFIEGAPEDLVLDGSFTTIFDSSLIKFSLKDASFSFRRELMGKVAIEAKGITRIWTERAVNRAGFEIVNEDADLSVSVIGSEGNHSWQLSDKHKTHSFSTLYELVSWLCNENHPSDS